jgi:hypothetical protein
MDFGFFFDEFGWFSDRFDPLSLYFFNIMTNEYTDFLIVIVLFFLHLSIGSTLFFFFFFNFFFFFFFLRKSFLKFFGTSRGLNFHQFILILAFSL